MKDKSAVQDKGEAVNIPPAKRYSTMLGGREIIFETGKYAKQVSGSVMVRYGDTVVMATAHMDDRAAPGDFLPLTVEYEERHYAIGKIPGSFGRREGRPSEQAILNARITDRQIRPLFPKGLRNEIQVIITILSADQENDPATVAAIATSAALSLSNIPWEGPTACVSVGYIDGSYVLNPLLHHGEHSQLELVVAASRDAVLMVEAAADELSEDAMVEAISFAHREMQPVIALIETMCAEVGKEKAVFEPVLTLNDSLVADMYAQTQQAGLRQALLTPGKHERSDTVKALRNSLIEASVPDPEAEGASEQIALLKAAFEKAVQRESRQMVLEASMRSDGRSPQDIRPIWIETDVLPMAHGSAVFTRGETQVMAVVTLGTGRDNRMVDDLGLDNSEEFMLHYNFPPYSTGEVKRLRGVSRRELGHGNLARRALLAVLPSQETFPYVVRVVGETLESNGSSSMATVCSSSLALMAAGVPIKKPVAGIAMGLIKEGDNYQILSDILGSEDALGDMDFKVTGTRDGVTALQMDIKIQGITPEIMHAALQQAKEGRLHILGIMDSVIAEPRAKISARAPSILSTKVAVEKIGSIIGPGGKQIRELEALGAKVEVDPDGMIRIYSDRGDIAEEVRERIRELTAEAVVGAIYEGKVAKILDFGAFVTLFPGTDGLLHISQVAEERVERIEDYLSVGDSIRVKVNNIDNRGKLDLIRPELEGKVAPRSSGGGSGGSGSSGGRGRGGDSRDSRGRSGGGRR